MKQKGLIKIVMPVSGFDVDLRVLRDDAGNVGDITYSATIYMGCGVQHAICASHAVRSTSRIFEDIAQVSQMLEEDVVNVINRVLQAEGYRFSRETYHQIRAEVDLCIQEANYRLREVIAPLVRVFNRMQIHAYADPEKMVKCIGQMDQSFLVAVQKHQFRSAARQCRSRIPVSQAAPKAPEPSIVLPEVVSGEPDAVSEGLDQLAAATLVAAGANHASAAAQEPVSS